MVEPDLLPKKTAHKSLAVFVAIAVLGGALGGYAIFEHRAPQDLAVQNAQVSASLNATRHELSALSAKVTMLTQGNTSQLATTSQPTRHSAQIVAGSRPSAAHRPKDDPRYKKMQSELDAQGKAIEQTRSDLANTQGNLVNTRIELSGSIAHTHDELVVLEKRGERDFAEFDIPKSKQFRRAGPIELRLKKANSKHQYADLELVVDDRNLSQKHVNLYQPVMYSTPDSPQPVEVVINDIGRDHIHGYVSAPKYRQSELASMSNPVSAPTGVNQGTANSDSRPASRQKLEVPQ